MKRTAYYIIQSLLLFSIAIGQNAANRDTGLNEAQLRNQRIQRQIGTDPKLTDPNMLDELLELEEQFDSTNVPVKILVTPAEIESYYRLKLKRLKEDIIGLNVIESLLDTAGRLNYFGYDYFYNFEQRELWERTIPPSDYILGPGDELIISVWGETERREKKILARDGTIFINDIGLIKIGELTLSKAENVIKKRFSRVYATMKGAKANTFIDVTHGKVSGKTLNFTGRVKSPGYHVISPFIDPLTALIYAGGVDTTGSLRDILIMREGSQLDTIDFYKFFIEGQSYRKIFLRESDRIHIPNRGSTVTITGEVMHPGIYELRSTESLGDLLEFAGGMNPGANSLAHLSRLHRINGRIHSMNMYISNTELDTFKINNGDIVTFYKMDYIPSYFHVYGIGSSPIKFPYDSTMSLAKLLKFLSYGPEKIVNKEWLSQIKIISDGEIRLFELKDILMEKIDYKPNPNDQIIFMKNPLYTIPGTIRVSGAIKQPGLYPVKKNGLPLTQVLLNAGGKLGNALDNGVQIFRDSLRLGWQSDQMLILDGDSISVLYDQNTIEVIGAVNAPGIYGIAKNSITIRSALRMAGGISPSGSDKRIYIIYPNGMVKSKGFLISPQLVSGSQLVIGVKSPDEYQSTLETTEKLAGIVGSLATLLLVINSTTITGN